MSNPSPGWREALIVALQHTLDCAYSAGQVPQALQAVPGNRLPALEEAMRRQYWHADFPGFTWPMRAPQDEHAIDAQLFCAGCHRDGRIRERALRLMRGRHGRLATALALLRCDDWAAPVRDCAEATLHTLLTPQPDALFAHIDLLLILRERSRIREGAWREQIEPALLHPSHHAQRWAALDSSRGRARLFVYGLILRADPTQANALALRAVQDRDPVIACWGLRELPQLAVMEVSNDVIAHALQHPHASVRAHALRARARNDDDAFRILLRESLLDASASVRHVAAYATRHAGLDPRAVWRNAIDRDIQPQNRHALLALSDCAEHEDLTRIAPWLQHHTGELRCAALRAALRAGIDDPADQLRNALRSPSGKVVGLALKLGVTVPAFMTRETLTNAFITAANSITRQRIVEATRKLGRWDALDCLLDMIDHGAHANEALHALTAWQHEIGHRYAPLSAERRRELLQRIDAMTPRNMHFDWLVVRRVVESS